MKPVRIALLASAVALLPAFGLVGCSHSGSQNQPGQSFSQGSNSSGSASSGNFTQGGGGQAQAPSTSASSNSGPSQAAESQPAAQQPVTVTIPRGTELRVALDQSISSATARAGDGFTATLLDPVRADGQTIIPRDARVRGHLVSAHASGRLSGTARLALTLDSVNISGQPVNIRTTTVARLGKTHKKRDIVAIGGGSALGAIIGGIAGGGKGAAIGAAAGAGAGTAGAAATGKEDITLPVESTLAFRLTAPITLTR